jgi:hypothetical protein
MKPIGYVLGGLLSLVCIAAGLYVGIDLMLVRGIIQIVHGAQHHPSQTGQIAWGVVRVVFCEAPISLGFFLAALIGSAMGISVGDKR